MRNYSQKKLVLLLVPLIFSSYTHLWNVSGFPDIFFDEGIYMRRTMNVIETGSPQEGIFYDHPYFGQLLLGGILSIVGFPESTNPSSDPSSLETLYQAPRVIMGILAIIDTFLIYQIAEKKFGRKIAFLAAVLFAIMPMSWLLRRILLENILLPFVLSSILFALYSKDSQRQYLLIILSGTCLGFAIFTKIPAFTLMPLIGFLIYVATKKLYHVGLWLIPVIVIPLIWPFYALSLGQINFWMDGILWQVARESAGIVQIIEYLFEIDNVLMSLGIAAFIFAIIKRRKFIIFWISPVMLFFLTVGFLQYFHWILLMPIMCIAIAIMINEAIIKIKSLQNYVYTIIVVIIVVFGLTFTSYIINTNTTSAQFEALSFVIENFNDREDITIVAGPVYTWILNVHDMNNVLNGYYATLTYPIETEKFLLISDPHFIIDSNNNEQLKDLYNDTRLIQEFTNNINMSEFYHGSYKFVQEGKLIEIKINW